MMTAQLFVLLGEHDVGRLTRDKTGSLIFEYEEAWLADESAYPLSISMPLTQARHSGDVVAAYLWGLLPDNGIILDGWAKRFKVSARNPFALLANVGEDCPEPFASSPQRGGTTSRARRRTGEQSPGSTSTRSRSACARCTVTPRHGVRRRTPASSASAARSPRRRCSSTESDGASLPGECRRRTS